MLIKMLVGAEFELDEGQELTEEIRQTAASEFASKLLQLKMSQLIPLVNFVEIKNEGEANE